MTMNKRFQKCIKNSHDEMNEFIKPGNELVIPLINQLREIMWQYCGVLKDKSNLEKGINELRYLKKRINNVDIRIKYNDKSDLINIFDLKASVISAEATLYCSLKREESRGAHQRSDFKNIEKKQECNYITSMRGNDLEIFRKSLPRLDDKMEKLIENRETIYDNKSRLLE